MIWISIILGIIQALPAIITLIQELLTAISGQPLGARLRLEHQLQGHLLDWHTGGDVEKLKGSLAGMGSALSCPSSAAFKP